MSLFLSLGVYGVGEVERREGLFIAVGHVWIWLFIVFIRGVGVHMLFT